METNGSVNQDSYPRLEMADSLIRDRTLYGKTKEDVIELLGKPSNEGYFKTYA
jgi:outer membrane protein assembly factor BamE (lipoprotein component of BamABCDE complex)